MFDMMGAVAPVDKHSLEVICALQLLRMERANQTEALHVLSETERSKLTNAIKEKPPEERRALLDEHDRIFKQKHLDVSRIFGAKERKIYIAASGKYSKIILAKR